MASIQKIRNALLISLLGSLDFECRNNIALQRLGGKRIKHCEFKYVKVASVTEQVAVFFHLRYGLSLTNTSSRGNICVSK